MLVTQADSRVFTIYFKLHHSQGANIWDLRLRQLAGVDVRLRGLDYRFPAFFPILELSPGADGCNHDNLILDGG